jgi:hypothetical protein
MIHFFGTDDLIGNQHILNTSLDKAGGLTDLLTANPDRTLLNLAQSNVRALMALGMGSEAHIAALERFLHPREVTLERIEVKHQGWCINFFEGITRMRRFPRGHDDFSLSANRGSG